MILQVKDLPTSLYKQCYHLNFQGAGRMQDCLVQARRGELQASIALCVSEYGAVLGWGIATLRSNGQAHNVHVFVREHHRRRGIGNELCKQLVEHVKTPCFVQPHDRASNSLFRKNKDLVFTGKWAEYWQEQN